MESGSSIGERIIVTLLGVVLISSIAALAYQLLAVVPVDKTVDVQLPN